MTFASVRAAAEHIARTGIITPHQLAALTAHDERLTDEQRQAFSDDWRAEGSPAEPPPQQTAHNSWDGVRLIAKEAGAKFPELVSAQWALESGWGKHTSGKNNYFGLKGKGTKKTTTEVINGKTVTIEAEFIDFDSIQHCVRYLVQRWYQDWEGHKGVNRCSTRDAAAQDLVKQGYATDPAYATKLINLMNQHQPPLQQGPPRGNPITAPWFSQLDSSTDQARRMCFSSSCAMLLATIRPGVLQGANGDDQYLKRVQQFGDTTDPAAQLKALASFGVKARFTKTADFATLEQQINRGIPVPCGYLHRGPVTAPAGGGHWLCVIGHTPTHVIVHDPLGEADLVGGTTLNSVARFARYSRANWGRRWMVEGPGTGWAIVAED